MKSKENSTDDLLKIVADLKAAIDDYFKLFLENYPLLVQENNTFGCAELYKVAIKAQCLACMLGEKAKKRLNYIGFSELFSFDNPVDWSNWKSGIVEKQIDHTIYASIAIRIDAELERIMFFLENGNWDAYNNFSCTEFLVSKTKYEVFFATELKNSPLAQDKLEKNISTPEEHISIQNINVSLETEKEAINNLDKMHKKSSTISNIVNVVSKIISMS